MERIYQSDVLVGTMRLGSWGIKMSSKELESFIDECVDCGAVEFDHADIYGFYTEEAEFGEVIKRRPDLKHKLRHTTKCGIKLVTENRPQHKIKSYDSTKQHIIDSAEQSLINLGIECLDVLLLHRPDYLMDPHEVAEAFAKLRYEGKVKYFGVSNFSSSQFELLNSVTTLMTNQVEISLLNRAAFDNGVLDQCLSKDIQPTAWSPFGGGKLFGTEEDEQTTRIKKVGNELAEKYNCQLDQLLLAWLRKHPAGIIPVLGTTKAKRVKDALAASQIELSHEEWYQLWEAASGEEVA